jgi:RimJ/RimL family protein N-acetyltransferase
VVKRIETPRTILRAWSDADVDAWVDMNADARVMERLGMTRDPRDDFEHPRIGVGHPLRPHVLYRIRKIDEPLVAVR